MSTFSRQMDSYLAYMNEMSKPRPSSDPNRSSGPSALAVLRILADTPSQALPMADLFRLSRLDIAVCAKAIESFKAAGLITVSGAGEGQMVQITPSGETVAKIA